MVNSGVADVVASYIIGMTEQGPQVLLAAIYHYEFVYRIDNQ